MAKREKTRPFIDGVNWYVFNIIFTEFYQRPVFPPESWITTAQLQLCYKIKQSSVTVLVWKRWANFFRSPSPSPSPWQTDSFSACFAKANASTLHPITCCLVWRCATSWQEQSTFHTTLFFHSASYLWTLFFLTVCTLYTPSWQYRPAIIYSS